MIALSHVQARLQPLHQTRKELARLTRFELVTSTFAGSRSAPLSYSRKWSALGESNSPLPVKSRMHGHYAKDGRPGRPGLIRTAVLAIMSRALLPD